jgi:hypothetical protein
MDIKEFLNLTIGNWFSVRTSHNLAPDQVENSKSDLNIEMLPPEAEEVVSLAQQFKVDPKISLGGTKITWDNSVDWGKTKQKGFALIILVPDVDNPQTGNILRQVYSPGISPTKGRYLMGADDSLTLIIEDNNTFTEERLWFASPNLRLRTSVIKTNNEIKATNFYSEIRKIPPKQ